MLLDYLGHAHVVLLTHEMEKKSPEKAKTLKCHNFLNNGPREMGFFGGGSKNEGDSDANEGVSEKPLE